MQLKNIFLIALTAFIAVSCVDDSDYSFDKMKIKSDLTVAAPIGTSTIYIANLLKSMDSKGLLDSTADGRLFLSYESTFESKMAKDKYKIPNLDIPTVNIPIVGTVIPISQKIQFWDKEVIGMNAKGGSFTITITSHTTSTTGELEFTLDNAKLKDGTVFKMTVPFGLNNTTNTLTKSIAGYIMHFDNSIPNTAQMPYTIKLTKTTAINDNSIDVKISYKDLLYEKMWGHLGTETIVDTTENLNIALLDNEFSKNVIWGNPQLEAITDNGLGMQSTLVIDSVHVKTKGADLITYFTSNINDSTGTTNQPSSIIDINYPEDTSKISMNDVNRYFKNTKPDETFYRNTDMFDKLMKGQNAVEISVKGITNIPGKPHAAIDFVNDTSRLKGKLRFTLPLYLKTTGITLTDSVKFDIASQLGKEENTVSDLSFRINATSQLPVDARLQIVFLDSANVAIDSMYNAEDIKKGINVLIKSGDGKPNSAYTTKYSIINIKDARLLSFKKTKKVVTKVTCITLDNGVKSVVFYNSYRLKVTFGMQVKATVLTDL